MATVIEPIVFAVFAYALGRLMLYFSRSEEWLEKFRKGAATTEVARLTAKFSAYFFFALAAMSLLSFLFSVLMSSIG
ncbi:MAG: hypothetical protein ABL959_11810 [Pyrinomonadaceae bacterium]